MYYYYYYNSQHINFQASEHISLRIAKVVISESKAV